MLRLIFAVLFFLIGCIFAAVSAVELISIFPFAFLGLIFFVCGFGIALFFWGIAYLLLATSSDYGKAVRVIGKKFVFYLCAIFIGLVISVILNVIFFTNAEDSSTGKLLNSLFFVLISCAFVWERGGRS